MIFDSLLYLNFPIISINQKYMIKIITQTSLSLLTRRVTNYFAVMRFPLPDLGEKIKEGKVRKLYVKEGDKVK